MSTRLQIILVSVIALMASLGFLATGIVREQGEKLQQTKQSLVLLNDQMKGLPEDKPPEIRDSTQSNSTSSGDMVRNLSKLSAASRAALVDLKPFPIENISDARELSPGRILAVLTSPEQKREGASYASRFGSLWVIDLKKMEFHLLYPEIVVGLGNYIWLHEWTSGGIAEIQLSPGEAVGDSEFIYVSKSGQVLVKAKYGTYNHSSNQIDVTFGEREKFFVKYIQNGECSGTSYTEYEKDESYTPPSVSLTGLMSSKRFFPFPKPINVECNVGYGEDIVDPTFPKPNFDGENIIVHFPGYVARINGDGVISYTQEDAYKIDCLFGISEDAMGKHYPILRLVHENDTGMHVIDENIWDDPLLSRFKNGYTCFVSAGIAGFERDTVEFFIISYLGEEDEEIGRVNYNIKTKEFENLSLSSIRIEGED